jgi:hypothetical protein
MSNSPNPNETTDTPGAPNNPTESIPTSPSPSTAGSDTAMRPLVCHHGTEEPLLMLEPNEGPKKGVHVRYDLQATWTANTVGDVYDTNLHDKYGQWRSVPGIPAGKLLVSSMGWVMMSDRKKWCFPNRGWDQKGYFNQYVFGHCYPVGRLICRAFNGPPPADGKVQHLADRGNCEAANLCWGTRSEARKRGMERDGNYVGNMAIPVRVRHVSWESTQSCQEFPDYKSAAGWLSVRSQVVSALVRELETNPEMDFAIMGKLQGWSVRKFHSETQDDLPATDRDRLSNAAEPVEEWRADPKTQYIVSNRGRIWKKPNSFHRGQLGKSTPEANPKHKDRVPSGLNNYDLHRMIFRAFSGEDVERDDWVLHRDGNKNNNNYSNLQFVKDGSTKKGIKRRRDDLVGIRREHEDRECEFRAIVLVQ